MVLDHHWWGRHFKRIFVPYIRSMIEVLEQRLLPTFANIESEAEDKQKEEWDRLCFLPASEDDDIDMSVLADRAFQTGQAYYEMMTGLRQGLLNLFAAALFHLYEQQLMLFHRRELLDPVEENDPDLFRHSVIRDRLRKYGINVTAFECWSKLEELRLLANTAKHAEGDSASRLRALRPDLFDNPILRGISLGQGPSSASAYVPLMGEDVFLSVADLKVYADAVQRFWEELLDAMASA